MLFENLAVITPHMRKGSLLPIAVTSIKRSALLPKLPTLAESGVGLDGFEVLGWFVLYAPAKTPPEVVKLLNSEINQMIAKPVLVQRLQELGAEPLGGTPEQVSAFVKGEQDRGEYALIDLSRIHLICVKRIVWNRFKNSCRGLFS